MLLNCDSLSCLVMVTVSCCLLQLVDCQLKRDNGRSLPWSAKKYPNPWLSPMECGRRSPAYICDVDKLFTQDQELQIDRILWEYSRSSICLCDFCGFAQNGIMIGVAAMEDADIRTTESKALSGGDTKPTWQQLADDIRKKWHFGTCDNDVVLVISPSGGAISFGEVTKKILEKSSILKLTETDFPKSRDEQFKFVKNIIEEIHSYELIKPISILDSKGRPILKQTEGTANTSKSTQLDNKSTSVGPPTIKEDESIVIAGASPIFSSPSSSSASATSSSGPIGTWGANSFIAAEEDDEFKAPEDNKISSSFAFMIVGSLTVILVSLIALVLIIWYYRTKTGNIEPNTMYTKPQTDEKTPSDIKAIKYEPCKTEEPGLPV